MKLHFTIRDLLWLTVVAALAVAWWLERRVPKMPKTTTRFYITEVPNTIAGNPEPTMLEIVDTKTGMRRDVRMPHAPGTS